MSMSTILAGAKLWVKTNVLKLEVAALVIIIVGTYFFGVHNANLACEVGKAKTYVKADEKQNKAGVEFETEKAKMTPKNDEIDRGIENAIKQNTTNFDKPLDASIVQLYNAGIKTANGE